MSPGPDAADEAGERARPRTLRLLGVLCLCAGLGLGAWVWHRAQAEPQASGYVVVDGVAYPQAVEDTKAYNRQMEVMGGKGLLAVEAFGRWLDGLSRSRGFAGLLAAVGLGAGWALFRAAGRPAAGDTDDSP
jgi:hypothetical protein